MSSLKIDLHVHFVPGLENPADSPSRRLSFQGSKLSPDIWSFVRDLIGSPEGHSIDLLALTPNVQTDSSGNPLPVIASFLSSLSIFRKMKLPYTLLVPDVIPRRFRWPLLLLLSTYFSVVCWLLKGQ